MKVYISADMEGASGITSFHQVKATSKDFERYRAIWTRDINQLVLGALDGGADSVIVNESHDGMNYLYPDMLHPSAEYISGRLKSGNQMEGVEGCDIAFLFAHARAGERGVLSHSFVPSDIFDIKINGRAIGELGMNILMASQFNVPVGLVVGDDSTCSEAKEIVSEIISVTTKKYITQITAHCASDSEVQKSLREGAHKAVKNVRTFRPFRENPPYDLEITLSMPAMTELISYIPGVRLVGPRTVSFRSDDYLELTKVRILMVNLARAVGEQLRA